MSNENCRPRPGAIFLPTIYLFVVLAIGPTPQIPSQVRRSGDAPAKASVAAREEAFESSTDTLPAQPRVDHSALWTVSPTVRARWIVSSGADRPMPVPPSRGYCAD